MKKLLELGNRYAKESSWKDYALVKFCLCAMGIIIGLLIPSSAKTPVMVVSAVVFLVTYIVLMAKALRLWKAMKNENK